MNQFTTYIINFSCVLIGPINLALIRLYSTQRPHIGANNKPSDAKDPRSRPKLPGDMDPWDPNQAQGEMEKELGSPKAPEGLGKNAHLAISRRLLKNREELQRIRDRLCIHIGQIKSRAMTSHDLNTVDRLDSLIQKIHPEMIKKYKDNAEALPKRLKQHIYGMNSYMFSSEMQFSFASEFFEDNRASLTEAAERFITNLIPQTIYKCMVIGITDEGEIKSPSQGAFYLSCHTRPEYLVMKMKSGIMHFALKYRGLDFANWTLSYKVWLTKEMILLNMDEAMNRIKQVQEKEMVRELKDPKNPFDKDIDISFYNRWVTSVGVYGIYVVDPKFLVQKTEEGEEFKIVVENVENAETVSWTDKLVNVEKVLWVRMFDDGVSMFYEGDAYSHFEVAYKTEFWQSDRKEFEYNNRFGAVDIETYSEKGDDGYGLQMPYAAGFKDYKGLVKMFYLENNENPHLVIVRMIEELLSDRHNGCTFYVHNLARFDSRFILSGLGLMGDVGVRLWGRDMNEIFKIRVSKKIGRKSVNIVFLDSFYQLPFKLDVLGQKFNTEVKKTAFPYKFVNANNLLYNGCVPPIDLFEGKISKEDYSNLGKKPWDLKHETLEYLEHDLECLFQVMHAYNRNIYTDFLVNAVSLPSYSALSKRVYITNFYKETKVKIPVISGYLEDWIRRAYKGGIVDVVQHIVGEAVKYDSNSHYPAAMLNSMPVGAPRHTDCKVLQNIFGFCHAEITAPDKQRLACPILPTWDSNGDLHCPRGVWRDTYFSEELKYAVRSGYKVKILSAIQFDKGEGLFDKFIQLMFKRKAEAKEQGDGVSELMYKLIQNSLYGKAGQKEIIHSFKLIDNNDVEDFELKYKTDLTQVFENKCLIRTQGKLEAELEGITTMPSHVENLYDEDGAPEEVASGNARQRALPRKKFGVKSSVPIAAAITAYARINMNQYKNIEGNKYLGGDTDSAILEKELPPALVGKGLGMMKEECRVSLGLFADKKLYLMKDVKGVSVIKSRGVGREAGGKDILTYRDFLLMFNGVILKKNKTKFIIKKDGIYIIPQVLTVRISNIRLAKIKQEMETILANYLHPLYNLVREIDAINFTSLIIWTKVILSMIYWRDMYATSLIIWTKVILSMIYWRDMYGTYRYYPSMSWFFIMLYTLMFIFFLLYLPLNMAIILFAILAWIRGDLNPLWGTMKNTQNRNLKWWLIVLYLKSIHSSMTPFNMMFNIINLSCKLIKNTYYLRLALVVSYINRINNDRQQYTVTCLFYVNKSKNASNQGYSLQATPKVITQRDQTPTGQSNDIPPKQTNNPENREDGCANDPSISVEESETKPIESENKPLESEDKSMESETKPLESEDKSMESETKPLESENKPIESETKPIESENKPLESEDKSMESETKPLESETKPLEYEDKHLGSENKPPVLGVIRDKIDNYPEPDGLHDVFNNKAPAYLDECPDDIMFGFEPAEGQDFDQYPDEDMNLDYSVNQAYQDVEHGDYVGSTHNKQEVKGKKQEVKGNKKKVYKKKVQGGKP